MLANISSLQNFSLESMLMSFQGLVKRRMRLAERRVRAVTRGLWLVAVVVRLWEWRGPGPYGQFGRTKCVSMHSGIRRKGLNPDESEKKR